MQADEQTSAMDSGPTSSHASGRWVLFGRIATHASQLTIFVVAARLLTPSEFGLFALVAAISALLFTLGAAGWREVIISTAQDADEISCTLTLAIITSLAMAVLSLLGAGFVHVLWQNDVASRLTAIFTITVLFSPIISAISGILVRSDRVPTLVICGIVGEAAGFIFAIVLLFAGWGVFALLAGKIVQQLIVLVLTLWQSGWRGPLTLGGHRRRALVRTSAHILSNRMISFLQGNISTFAIGFFLGPTGVGFFRAADRVVSSVAELVTEPARMIAWLQFRAVDDVNVAGGRGSGRVAAEARYSFALLLTLTAPIFTGLAMIADDLILLVLGPAWAPAAPVAELLALCGFAVVPAIVAEPVFSKLGCVDKLSRVLLLNAVIMIVCVSLSGGLGLVGVAAAVLAANIIAFGTSFSVLVHETGNDWRQFASDSLGAVLPAMALVVTAAWAEWLSESNGWGPVSTIVMQIATGAAAYLGLVSLMRPDFVRQLVRL